MDESRTPLRDLRQLIVKHFGLSELQTLAFDLTIDWEILKGEDKLAKVLSLLNYVTRHDQLARLIYLLRQERPFVDWPAATSFLSANQDEMPSTTQPASTNTIAARGGIIRTKGISQKGESNTIEATQQGEIETERIDQEQKK